MKEKHIIPVVLNYGSLLTWICWITLGTDLLFKCAVMTSLVALIISNEADKIKDAVSEDKE